MSYLIIRVRLLHLGLIYTLIYIYVDIVSRLPISLLGRAILFYCDFLYVFHRFKLVDILSLRSVEKELTTNHLP